jgi:WASH complex subunit FAM21
LLFYYILKEKTKEEKEAELLIKINDAVNIGMSIMDKYFTKIENTNKDKDDIDDEDMEENEEDVDIYEVKDPYVLRNLPHLIGSAAYLEDDHVGLIDYEDEEEIKDEEQEEEEVEVEEKSETLTEVEDEEDEASTEQEPKTMGGLSLTNGLSHNNDDEEESLFKSSNFKVQ